MSLEDLGGGEQTFDGLRSVEVVLHELNAVDFARKLVDHVRQLFEHQPAFHIWMSRLEPKQVMATSAAQINDKHFVLFSIPQPLLDRISALLRPRSLPRGLHGHHSPKAFPRFWILRKILEERGVRHAPCERRGRVSRIVHVLPASL
jgi:hypothetical protein